jgi:CSLREA domain-containing protein
LRVQTFRGDASAGLRAVLAAVLFISFIGVVPPGAVHAASVVLVTRTDDPLPGTCTTTGKDSCSLREAVIYANVNPDATTITLPAGMYTLTFTGAGEEQAFMGDLDVRTDVTINGAGAATTIIDGDRISGFGDRVFDIFPSLGPNTVAINNVTIQHGFAHDLHGGGGIWIGDSAALTLTDSIVADNSTTDGKGGGIATRGPFTHLTLVNTIIDHNEVTSQVLGSAGIGGGVLAEDSTVVISNSTLSDNTVQGAQAGGVGSGVKGGAAYGGGVGGIGAPKVAIVNSTLERNEVRGGNSSPGNGNENHGGPAGGGGVGTPGTAGTWSIVNSTVVNGDAIGGPGSGATDGRGGLADGAGIHLGGSISLVNDTITDNDVQGGTVTPGGMLGLGVGGGLATFAGSLTVSNTIVAANRIVTDTDTSANDVFGSFTSGGHNLIGVRDGGSALDPTDLSGSALNPLDPKLAVTPASNGGKTRTVALLAGSPAINAGDNAICARPLPPAASPNGPGNLDQRGIARPQPTGGACDIGAYEYVFAPSTTTLTSSANPAAIGQAITFTVNVAASGSPTGSVVLRDGPTSIGGGTLAAGVVTVTTAALGEGSHSITATYGGDTAFGPSAAAVTQAVGTPSLQFFPLSSPLRLLDTRAGHVALVQPGAPLAPNVPSNLPGHFSIGGVGVPSEALALVGNATVDNTAGVPPGFATIYPNGSGLPLASNLNFVPGTVRPNQFTVGLGGDGTFNLLSSTGGNFIIDITGYYAPPAPGGLYFHPLSRPVRLLDTRPGAPALVQLNAALTAGQTLNLSGLFTSGGVTVPASAKALAGNATVDNTVNAPAGFATLFPGGTALPPTSNLNYAGGTVAPNAFTVGLGGDGSFNLYSNSGGNFILDVTGYYDSVPSGGLLFHVLPQPVRELDTRPGESAAVHPGTPLTPGVSFNLPGSFAFAGISVPSTAAALVGNATVDNTINAPAGFATLYPGGNPLPLASNLNYSPGLVAPNAFIVGVGTDGMYNLFSQSGSNFIIDISGYFSAS